MTSRTSEMASFDSIMPPSTHCSAARSCGGVRSNSSPRGMISAPLTRGPSPALIRPAIAGRAVVSHVTAASPTPGPTVCLAYRVPQQPPILHRPPPDPCLFYRTAPTVVSVSRKAPNHAVHRPGDSLCRHAGTAVRSLGIPLWTVLWKSRKLATWLGKHSAQAVHTRFFDLGTTRLAAISYPHQEFHVQRHPGTLPGPGEAASRSADLPGGRVSRQIDFDYVFEGQSACAAVASCGSRPDQSNRRA